MQVLVCSSNKPDLSLVLQLVSSIEFGSILFENLGTGASLLVQWLRFYTSMQHVLVRLPGQGTGSHMPHGKAKKKKKKRHSRVKYKF